MRTKINIMNMTTNLIVSSKMKTRNSLSMSKRLTRPSSSIIVADPKPQGKVRARIETDIVKLMKIVSKPYIIKYLTMNFLKI